MSHSTVLVIGENPEEQLAPFIKKAERLGGRSSPAEY